MSGQLRRHYWRVKSGKFMDVREAAKRNSRDLFIVTYRREKNKNKYYERDGSDDGHGLRG